MHLSKIEWHRIRGLTISTLITFCLLIGLGVWQLQRLKWKEGILAAIHQAQTSPPIVLPDHPTRFEKVFINGTWVQGRAAMYGDEVHDTGSGPIEGGELLMAMRRDDGETVLVDLGWVHERSPAPMVMPQGEQRVVGYIHEPERPGWFAGKDDPKTGLYYTLDPEKIGAGMGLMNVSSTMLIAMGQLPPFGSPLPQPAQNLPTPPNNHYEYALTWFGFALVLLFEYVLLARKRLRVP